MPACAAESVPWHGPRGRARHAPARDGRGREPERIATALGWALEHQRDGSTALSGELKTPRGGRGHPLGLANHGTQAAMAETLLQQREQLGVVPRLGVEHALGIEPRLIEARREQVAGAYHPQHRPGRPRGDAGHKQGRSRLVAPVSALARHLVQRVDPEAGIAKPSVDRAKTEGQDQALMPAATLDGA